MRVFYESLVPIIRDVARGCGYAIGVHGSMRRDLDLIAVPWVEKCSTPYHLFKSLQMKIVGFMINKEPATKKPHGRIAYVFCVGSHAYVDLSIIPPRVR
jgi:regulator of PEP synthase PpsR (kinase-PPPase family)